MSITALYVQRRDDPEAVGLLARLKRSGYPQLENIVIERVYRLEGDIDPSQLVPVLINALYESIALQSDLDPQAGPIVEVGYQLAVIDPETASIMEAAAAVGCEGLVWVRLAKRYQLVGVCKEEAQRIAKEFLFNPVVEVIIRPKDVFGSLVPAGEPSPVEIIGFKGLSDAELERLSEERSWYAPLSQMKALQSYEIMRGRPFTDAEIEIVVQSWCDHCYHTTWKGLKLLEHLRSATELINHPLVISAFYDNAGGMLFYDGYVLIIKGETHNFPTSIAPFGGVATKHGGVIRDVIGFGRGGYPIGGTTVMGTMDPKMDEEDVPEGALHPAHIVRESIRATAYYLNPMGIPMMVALYRAHPGYAKPLALGHSIGIIPAEYAIKEEPRPGDAILLIGGRTGRDGIHGATASSTGVSEETAAKEAAAVQIGHPIVERKFASAIPELRDAGCIRSLTDLGAGGISCAVGEMAARTGAVVFLDEVPLKDESLAAWEILLSESQERMLIAVPLGRVGDARRILKRYGVESSLIGWFTDSKRFQALHKGRYVVDLEMSFLWGGCPIDPVPTSAPHRRLSPTLVVGPDSPKEWERRIKLVLGHYHLVDQSPAGTQFDSTVQGRTVVGRYGDYNMPNDVYVSAPVRGKPYGAVFAVSFNPFWGDIYPAGAARLAVVEAITKLVAAGVDPAEIVLCDNFYTPRAGPEIAWDLEMMVKAIADLSLATGIPFISGKDSSSGTFVGADGRAIDVPLTLVASALGRVPDVQKLVTKLFKQAGSKLVLIGHYEGDRLGGSVYLDSLGERGNRIPDFGINRVDELLSLWRRIHTIYRQEDNPILSASAIAEGGLLVRLFEMALGGGLGVKVDLSVFEDMRLDEVLFSEMVGSILLEVTKDADLEELFDGLPWRVVGEVSRDQSLRISDGEDQLVDLPVADLVEVWERPFEEVV